MRKLLKCFCGVILTLVITGLLHAFYLDGKLIERIQESGWDNKTAPYCDSTSQIAFAVADFQLRATPLKNTQVLSFSSNS